MTKNWRKRLNEQTRDLISRLSPSIAEFLTAQIKPKQALMGTAMLGMAANVACEGIPNDDPKCYDFSLPDITIVSEAPTTAGKVYEDYPEYQIIPSEADASCYVASANNNGFFVDENNMLKGKPYHASNSTLGLTELKVICDKEKFNPAEQTFTIEIESGNLPGSTIQYIHIQEENIDDDPEPEAIAVCEENKCRDEFVPNNGAMEARVLQAEHQIADQLTPVTQLDVPAKINPPVIIHYVPLTGDSTCPTIPSILPNATTSNGGNLTCIYKLNDVTEPHEFFHSTTYRDIQMGIGERFAYPLEEVVRNSESEPQFSLCNLGGISYNNLLKEMCTTYRIDVDNITEFLQKQREISDLKGNLTSLSENKCTFDLLAGEIAGAPVNTYSVFYPTVCQGTSKMTCSTNPLSIRYVEPNECSDTVK